MGSANSKGSDSTAGEGENSSTKSKVAVAKANGKALGRTKSELPKDFVKQYDKFKKGDYGDMSSSAFAKMLGIGRSTLLRV